jgi:hypothetical protein
MFILTQILIGRDIHLRRLVVLAVLAGVEVDGIAPISSPFRSALCLRVRAPQSLE